MKNKDGFDVIIIGGGLAGLTNAIHLAKHTIKVLLIEKNSYPKHKVCGEYVSNEILPYLNSLGIDPFSLGAQRIDEFQFTTKKSNIIKSKLPLGGFGISRYTLDNALAEKAKLNGATIGKDTVLDVKFSNDSFIVSTKNNSNFNAKVVIGAYGKRSNLDIKLDRNFIKKKSPFLAVKTHVEGDFPNDLVALHNFEGGYCGVSKVENNVINLCYIANFKTFKKYKDIQHFQQEVVLRNNYLKDIFNKTKPLFSEPITISQISFSAKKPIENHIMMCGDTAGMIHPLCGNGMGMAIRSAQIASNLIVDYFNGTISSRKSLENAYSKKWNKEFKTRLKMGRILSSLFNMSRFSDFTLAVFRIFPGFVSQIVRLTHGKPMTA